MATSEAITNSIREVGAYLQECFFMAIMLREKRRATLAFLLALITFPAIYILGPKDANAAFLAGVGVFAWALAQLLILAPFEIWRQRKAFENSLRVRFSVNLDGCKSFTKFADGRSVVYFRLEVRPPKGQTRARCAGRLVDILAPYPDVKSWVSIWSPQRLRLTWATHQLLPETEVDLRDDEGEFLDVFCVSEDGIVRPCTPNLVLPTNWKSAEFTSGNVYLLRVMLTCDGYASKEVGLRLVWPNDWRHVDVVMLGEDV